MEEFRNEQNSENIEETVKDLGEKVQDEAVTEGKAEEQTAELIMSSKSSMKKEILDWVFSIAVALIIALLIRRYLFTLVKVDGPSMQPTLYHNDMLYVNRFMYTPKNGDIIIFRPPNSPSTPYVKRIIATEGQTVVIDAREKKVYVDGEELKEEYIDEKLVSAGTIKYPFTVPEDHVFVLGDNRNNSRDSRDAAVGAVPRESIIGKVIFRMLPITEFGSVYED